MQFVHTLLAVLRRGFKHGRDRALDFASLLAAQGKQREDRRRRMGHHHRARLQLRSNGLARLPLDPGRADRRSRFIFQRVREIHDGIAQVARYLPVIARRARVGSEEGEVHALELFRADTLDKAHLVANRFQLAERLVVIEQADIDGGKIPFAQDFSNLFALERCRAHNRHAIKIRAAQIRLRAGGFGKGSF